MLVAERTSPIISRTNSKFLIRFQLEVFYFLLLTWTLINSYIFLLTNSVKKSELTKENMSTASDHLSIKLYPLKCYLNTVICYLLIKTPGVKATRSKVKFAPTRAINCRGKRSVLTTGVDLRNLYLLGEEGAAPSALRRRLASSLWGCGSIFVE